MAFRAGMEYEERGRGEAVALVHAGVFPAWFAQLHDEPALDDFRVIRPIRPGYGGSAMPPDHYTLRDHARRCGTLLREIGADRVHWVGHSSSCCIGLQLALDDPELVASLVLYEPARPAGPIQRENAPRYVRPALDAAWDGDLPTAFDVFLRGVGGDGYRDALEAVLGSDGVAEALRESAYFFADELLAVAEWDFDETAGSRISAPTLVVCGSDSPPWFPENTALLARMVPGTETATLPGLDHLAPLTHPDRLAEVIAGHVRRNRPAAP